ncbi:MAG: hypothetical protein VX498_03485 [Myxococcota bacterium]|nr:hypothetical protein [Myxococcota bacterium]
MSVSDRPAVRVGVASALLLPVLWAGLDLLLHHDLPGAQHIQHAAFRGLVVPLEWLTEGTGRRLELVGAAWLLTVAVALPYRRHPWANLVLRISAALLAVGGLVTVGLAVLMERGLALGIAVSVLLSLRGPVQLQRRPGSAGPGAVVLAVLASLASLYYVYALFMTRGEGYPLLQSLGDALRRGGSSWFPVWVVAVVLVGVAALVAHRPNWKNFVLCSLPGLLIAAMSGSAGGLVVVPVSVALVALLLPGLFAVEGAMRWPARVALPCILAGLLFGHTYSARVLHCPAEDHPRLELLASPGEVFRIAMNSRGDLAMALRADRRFATLDPTREEPALELAASGPLTPPWPADESLLYATPEELVYAPSLDRFFASVIPMDPDAWLGREQGSKAAVSAWNSGRASRGGAVAPSEAGASPVRNVVVTLDGRGEGVEDAFAIPDLCWINTMHWDEADRLLYLGCEEVPGLHRYDPQARGLVDEQGAVELGDVQDLAFGQGEAADRIFSISLWRSRQLTELDRATLQVLRQVPIGGMHYHLAYAPESALLFASSYYGGRVHVVDATTMEGRGSLSADFGTREVAVHQGLGLLLASSTYAGTVRIWSISSGDLRLQERLEVGGHIKDIRVDQAGERAWFWSQCGLYELNLQGL